ncbi:hypothetical protein BH10PSE18_BH10PSE18_07980 [soil metagenome]
MSGSTPRQRVKPGFIILSIAFAIPALMFASTVVRLLLGIA